MAGAIYYELKTTNHKEEMTFMKIVITPENSLLTMLHSRSAIILIALTLGTLALVQSAEAVNPPPDGGYPNLNTAEGDFALFSLTSGGSNTAIGFNALGDNTTGSANTATGLQALVSNTAGNNNTADGVNALFGNTTGNFNTACGFQALETNTTGSNNTANGTRALTGNTTGSNNTATGVQALNNNTTGIDNTANGFNALFSNTTGVENTAEGLQALFSNTTGSSNTAAGFEALFSNTTGSNNTANGFDALASNTTGINNTATGSNALPNNTVGRNNTAEGVQALNNNTMGINNVGVGVNALLSNTTGNLDVAIGVNSLLRNTTGSSNIALGVNAGSNLTIGNGNIDIGNAGVAAEANTTRLGTQGTQRRAFIAGISGTAVTGSAVVVNANGQLGVAASSKRFKDDIKPMNNVSESILELQPVTFRYKKSIDPDRIPQFGLVAEEVAKVNADLVTHDAKGEVYTVRYEAVNAMLLNEFIKEHRKNEEQENTIAELRSGMTALAAIVKEQESHIQKVSAQLATATPSRAGLEATKVATRRARTNGSTLEVLNNF